MSSFLIAHQHIKNQGCKQPRFLSTEIRNQFSPVEAKLLSPKVQPVEFYFIGFWVKSGFCKNTQLDGFWDLYEFSVIRNEHIKYM